MSEKAIYFFIGTEAELIKLFPLLLELDKSKTPYRIIASGQNDIKNSTVLKALNGGTVDLELSQESDIKKSAAGLIQWFLRTWRTAKKMLLATFGKEQLCNALLIVHGDTVSTLMGAYLGKHFSMRVGHVEAGLRSHNWLHPFPEEIDRVLTSRKAEYHFAPGQLACQNLKNVRGKVVDTVYNTVVDSLAYSRTVACKDDRITALQKLPYFVFVLHRQENLANKALVSGMMQRVLTLSTAIHCVFILHKPTEVALQEMGLLEKVLAAPCVTALPRVEYFDFMKLLDGAAYVITDGGSNQEELSYMGKPCLIMRLHTERQDGIGENAILYGGNLAQVDSFTSNYQQYCREPIQPDFSPAARIAAVLREAYTGGEGV